MMLSLLFAIMNNFCSQGTISQNFFAASPRHPILYNAVHYAIDTVLSRHGTQPPKHTGPGALKNGHRVFLNSTDVGIHHLKQTTIQTSPIDGRRVSIEPERGLLERDYLGHKKRSTYHDMGMKHFNENMIRSWRYGPGKFCWQFVGLPSLPTSRYIWA